MDNLITWIVIISLVNALAFYIYIYYYLKNKTNQETIILIIINIIIITPLLTVIYYKAQNDNVEKTFSSIKKQQEQIDSNLRLIGRLYKTKDSLKEKQGNFDSLFLKNNKIILNAIDSLKQQKIANTKSTTKEKKDGITPPVNHSIWFWISTFLFGSTILLIISAIIFEAKRKLLLMLASLTGTLSLATKLTFEGKISFEPKITIELKHCNTSTSINSIDTEMFVGPFIPGYDSLDVTGKKRLDTLKNAFSDTTKHFNEITIYGGVDIRPLHRKSLLRYGDNLSLSQARANYVRDFLRTYVFNPKTDKAIPKFIILINGANSYGNGYDPGAFARSRCVRIVGKYTTNKSEKNPGTFLIHFEDQD
jgi:hypothetical protein